LQHQEVITRQCLLATEKVSQTICLYTQKGGVARVHQSQQTFIQ
jgi:hypothetical protein